jgi:hypothetical protein
VDNEKKKQMNYTLMSRKCCKLNGGTGCEGIYELLVTLKQKWPTGSDSPLIEVALAVPFRGTGGTTTPDVALIFMAFMTDQIAEVYRTASSNLETDCLPDRSGTTVSLRETLPDAELHLRRMAAFTWSATASRLAWLRYFAIELFSGVRYARSPITFSISF